MTEDNNLLSLSFFIRHYPYNATHKLGGPLLKSNASSSMTLGVSVLVLLSANVFHDLFRLLLFSHIDFVSVERLYERLLEVQKDKIEMLQSLLKERK